MLCAIYRSQKHEGAYLYIEKRNDFSRVPSALMAHLGALHFAMLLPLDGRKKLINADIVRVRNALESEGFYLQLPPPLEEIKLR